MTSISRGTPPTPGRPQAAAWAAASAPASPLRSRAPGWRLAVAAGAAALLVGCGGARDSAPASQAAAKVNKDEITVHQINFVLQQQRNLRPEQTEAARRAILERLIDQQLALQKADDLKLDREPRVVQRLEAARREIIASAYLEKVREAAVKPTPQEITAYYQSKPALFAERRVYNLQEILIEARPEQAQALREKLAASRSIPDFLESVKAEGLRFSANQAVRAAEQLPLANLDAFAGMKDGQAMFNVQPQGVQVVVLAGSRSQPVSEEQARPAIEQFLLEERRRKLAEDDLKALRTAAKVTYVAPFAAPASGAITGAAGSASGVLPGSDVSRGIGLK
ncbi:MAG: EpsD family peptidyl-prolyl cis-trans isomerase [Rubrivivax sp.]